MNATGAETKKELHNLIELIPINKLEALKPLLHMLSENDEIVIETDLTPEEIKIMQAGEKELKEHPENFVLFD